MKNFNITQIAPLSMKQQTIIIGEGVIFTDNRCAVNWGKTNSVFSGMAFFDSINHIYELYDDIQINFLQQVSTNSYQYENELLKNGKFINKRSGALAFKECFSSDSNHMCNKCDCWKKTRLECS